jgi:hypothetical protein
MRGQNKGLLYGKRNSLPEKDIDYFLQRLDQDPLTFAIRALQLMDASNKTALAPIGDAIRNKDIKDPRFLEAARLFRDKGGRAPDLCLWADDPIRAFAENIIAPQINFLLEEGNFSLGEQLHGFRDEKIHIMDRNVPTLALCGRGLRNSVLIDEDAINCQDCRSHLGEYRERRVALNGNILIRDYRALLETQVKELPKSRGYLEGLSVAAPRITAEMIYQCCQDNRYINASLIPEEEKEEFIELFERWWQGDHDALYDISRLYPAG